MRKIMKLEGEICANCAAKIQDKINQLEGVNDAKVNFMFQKFTLDAADDRFDDILDKSVKIFGDIEPDCTVLVSRRVSAFGGCRYEDAWSLQTDGMHEGAGVAGFLGSSLPRRPFRALVRTLYSNEV